MLGKRIQKSHYEAAAREWECVAICDWGCIRTGDALCTCSKSSAKSSSSSYASKRNHDHMRNLTSSSQ